MLAHARLRKTLFFKQDQNHGGTNKAQSGNRSRLASMKVCEPTRRGKVKVGKTGELGAGGSSSFELVWSEGATDFQRAVWALFTRFPQQTTEYCAVSIWPKETLFYCRNWEGIKKKNNYAHDLSRHRNLKRLVGDQPLILTKKRQKR